MVGYPSVTRPAAAAVGRPWHDGRVIVRRFLVAAAAVAALVLSIPATALASPATTVPQQSVTQTTALGDNSFIPENVNFGDCVSSMPRPDCGSASQGGFHQLATFAVLMLGMAFIGLRVAYSMRRNARREQRQTTP